MILELNSERFTDVDAFLFDVRALDGGQRELIFALPGYGWTVATLPAGQVLGAPAKNRLIQGRQLSREELDVRALFPLQVPGQLKGLWESLWALLPNKVAAATRFCNLVRFSGEPEVWDRLLCLAHFAYAAKWPRYKRKAWFVRLFQPEWLKMLDEPEKSWWDLREEIRTRCLKAHAGGQG